MPSWSWTALPRLYPLPLKNRWKNCAICFHRIRYINRDHPLKHIAPAHPKDYYPSGEISPGLFSLCANSICYTNIDCGRKTTTANQGSQIERHIKGLSAVPHYTGCHKYVPFARFPNRRNIICNILKLLQTWQPLCYFFYWKKYRLLRNDMPLSERYFDKRSKPDWLLICRIEGSEPGLVRIGSHADLFEKK